MGGSLSIPSCGPNLTGAESEYGCCSAPVPPAPVPAPAPASVPTPQEKREPSPEELRAAFETVMGLPIGSLLNLAVPPPPSPREAPPCPDHPKQSPVPSAAPAPPAPEVKPA